MSALGDYVHFRKYNYSKYNVNKIQEGPGVDYNTAANQIKAQINTEDEVRVCMAKAKELQKKLNDIFYNDTDDGSVLQFRKLLMDALQKKLDDEFGSLAGKVQSDFTVSGSGNYNQQLKDIVSVTKGQVKAAQGEDHKTYTGKLLNKIKSIQKELNNLQANNQSSESILAEIQKVRIECGQIYRDLYLRIQAEGTKTINFNNNDVTLERVKNLIIAYSKVNLNIQKGKVFEWAVAPINYNIENLALDGADEATRKMLEMMGNASNNAKGKVVGDVSYKVKRNSNIRGKLNENAEVVMTTTKSGDMSIKSKIDVLLNEAKGIDPTGLSLKNTSHMNWIHIAGGTTLYNLLELGGYYDFANHYINIITRSESGAQGSISATENITDANAVVRSLAIQSALVGYLANKPEFLVINDTAEAGKPQIKVFSMRALIAIIRKDILSTNSGRLDALVEGIKGDTYITQSWEKAETNEIGQKRRIDKLLAKLQTYKIDAYIDNTIFASYMKFMDNQGLTR